MRGEGKVPSKSVGGEDERRGGLKSPSNGAPASKGGLGRGGVEDPMTTTGGGVEDLGMTIGRDVEDPRVMLVGFLRGRCGGGMDELHVRFFTACAGSEDCAPSTMAPIWRMR